MDDQLQLHSEPVAPELYSRDYYLGPEGVPGAREFGERQGKAIHPRLRKLFDEANVGPDTTVLDIGCGRGDVVFCSAAQGAHAVGLDYSPDAIGIANSTLKTPENAPLKELASFVSADAKKIPFPDRTFDIVFMFDVVEHLRPWELHECLTEVKRVLKPEGRLILETAPNTWFLRFGQPFEKLARRLLQGKTTPTRSKYDTHVHVNEQSIITLKKLLRKEGLAGKVRLEPLYPFQEDVHISRLLYRVDRFLCAFYPFKLIFSKRISAVARKIVP